MIEFGGTCYYIDFEAIDKIVAGDKSLKAQVVTDSETSTTYDEKNKLVQKTITEIKHNKPKEVDGSKYDMVRLMLEIVLTEKEMDGDDTLGADRVLAKSPLSFKIAFNTLLQHGILKEKE